MDMLQHAATVNGSVPSDTNITDDTNASANQRLADTGNSFDADTPSVNVSVELDGMDTNLSWTRENVSDDVTTSNGSAFALPWHENVSEDVLEDANESAEIDDVGWNFSDWTEENASTEVNTSNGSSVIWQEHVAVAGNASANDSDVRDVNVSVEIDGMDSNLSEWTRENASDDVTTSNGSAFVESIPLPENASFNDSDVWRHTDVADNASVGPDDENVSEEFLEDANESAELDDVGWNFSDWTEENASEAENTSNGSVIIWQGMAVAENASANDSDAWRQPDPAVPYNTSVAHEAGNASEERLDDVNESVDLDGMDTNLSEWMRQNASDDVATSNGSAVVVESIPLPDNSSFNDSDVAYNASDENVSEDVLEDANESVEPADVGWNLSNWSLG
ncbi:unnamed protein product [Symbiodinium natans]|uniref:Uncharacterized protein n=1 Tax=Symbiodinium natans TaxID=878477 RepID=A0A812LNZ7_9DINO|nr:unnamed protein product [Symbiodinium natans]